MEHQLSDFQSVFCYAEKVERSSRVSKKEVANIEQIEMSIHRGLVELKMLVELPPPTLRLEVEDS